MAVIEKRGVFDFNYETPDYRIIWCTVKSSLKFKNAVKANFNVLQITYKGTVRVQVTEKITENVDFVTIQEILPQKKDDEDYFFDYIIKELKLISGKRKEELRKQQKEKKIQRQKITA